MPAITFSRLATALVVIALAACNEPFSTPPNEPSATGELTVIPSSATIHAGQMVALKASIQDRFGDEASGVAVRWSSSNEAVATVAANGEVLGLTPGGATITAEAAGKSRTSGIRVLPGLGKEGSDADL